MKRLILMAPLALLAGCAGGVKLGTTNGDQQAVFQAESDYQAALTVAVTYENLPVCGTAGAGVVCSDVATGHKITMAAQAAWTALQAAQVAVTAQQPNQSSAITAIEAATAAVQALVTLTSSLPKGS